MKQYEGTRTPKGCVVTVDGKPLNPRYDLWNHSPTGFEWGYGGSGPAQLALALLADAIGDDEALLYYQLFKGMEVAGWHTDHWGISEEYIKTVVLFIAQAKDVNL